MGPAPLESIRAVPEGSQGVNVHTSEGGNRTMKKLGLVWIVIVLSIPVSFAGGKKGKRFSE
jgi:hypothetical protein